MSLTHERWYEGKRWKRGQENIEPAIPAVVEVTLGASTAGTETTIDHNLGRIPNSMSITNVYYDAGATPGVETWHRLDGDDEWDERQLKARFSFEDASILVEIT